MKDQEEELDILEQEIPKRAATAFSEAFQRAIQRYGSALASGSGHIYRVEADGKKCVVKDTEPPTYFLVGTKVHLG